MAELNRIEQLDAAIEAQLAPPAAPRAPAAYADAEVAVLAQFAAELRHLPSPAFRARLASDLQRRAQMAGTASAPAPTPLPPVAPYLAVHDAAAAIEFYGKAFGAVEVGRLSLPDGRIAHAEILIGGASVMLADEMPEYGFLSPQTIGGAPLKLHHYCSDVDTVIERAIAAGGKLTRPIQDEFYGNREGQVADPFGYTWIVSTRKEEPTWEEVERRFRALMEQQAAATEKKPAPSRKGIRSVTPYLVVERHEEFLAFLTQAFDARETFRAPGSAGGTHVELRIGDTKIMAGGGRGIPGYPSALHLYVPDADAVYRRALAAGATSFYEPMDQPYGDREAGIRDGFGNSWYIATHQATGHRPPGMRSVTPTLHPRGADSLMDFMKRALAAEEVDCTRMPDGAVMHAQMRVGESLVELGEARGAIEPTTAMLLLEVDNVDAWHRRAIEAGADSIEAPADQPYGARRAGVNDAHGNAWYFSAPLPVRVQPAEENRAVSPAKETRATVIPCLRYQDAPAAIEWLCRVFGFEKHLVVPNPDGTIAHAQLSFGNGMIMLGSVRPD
ncbi:MAG: VOC family protein, partial [Candidatus Acidiferrales bacterium]